MAPPRKNVSAAALLLVAIMAATAAWMHAESASVGDYDTSCNNVNLSGAYKGVCWPWFDDHDCASICVRESGDNVVNGWCGFFQCMCVSTRCTPEIVAAASDPTPVSGNDTMIPA
jgi:hypothetical protein